ncbi:MAG: TetR/AcrR family transcriptional regulator [Deltaproteobacteria bacterium]|nr:TetR/AcrR family transcriptional regulator [Deltaproteobacteria bacterium]
MGKTADRLLTEATQLFADRGYEGTSVRAICTAAEANVNAVSYHFGGKKGLYAAVLRSMGDDRLASAQRILGAPPSNRTELETRLLLFAEETLATLLAAPGPLIILFAEFQQGFRNCGPEAVEGLAEQNRVVIEFLQGAADAGLLRSSADLDIVAGAFNERLNNQVMHADRIHTLYGDSIKNPEYRAHWTRQTIDLMLYGAAKPA